MRSLQAQPPTAMLGTMKRIKTILFPTLLFPLIISAELYKGLDSEGNIIYSDTPFNNSKEFTAPAITVVDAPKVQTKKNTQEKVIEKEKPKEFKYTSFNITAPVNDETIWNAPQLMVSMQLKPALNTEEGHNIWLMMDDKPLVKNSRNLSIPISRADRGSHTLQGQIRSSKGKIIKRTKSITVHIKNSVVQRKAR